MQVPPSGPGNSWLPRNSFQSSMGWKSAAVPVRNGITFSRRLSSNIAAPLCLAIPFGTIILQGAWRAGGHPMAQKELTADLEGRAPEAGVFSPAGGSRSGHVRGIVQD